jgi:hypothetical protein
MAEEKKDEPQSIDYSGSQADIDKAKQAAHEADRKRLAKESSPNK